MPRHTLRVLAVAAVALLAGYGCTDVDTPTSPAPTAASLEALTRPSGDPLARFNASGRAKTVRETVGPAGGVLTVAGNTLVFPAGAVSEPTQITMTASATVVGVEVEPHGLQFPRGSEPVLTLSYAGVDVSAFRTLNIVYVGADGEILEVLPTDASGGEMTARLRHFSGYWGAGSRSVK